MTTTMTEPVRADRTVMPYDVVIVGGGPSGLACAIRLKQLDPSLSVCVLEKGAEIGAHLLSGAVFEPRALAELFPDYMQRGAPLKTPAKRDAFYFLTKKMAFRLPTPPTMHNTGNYIISLGELGKWLGTQAEQLGVEIFAGFAASELLYGKNNRVIGVATGDVGLDKNRQPTDRFTPGVEIHARQVILAEGCHGSLTKTLIDTFNLRDNSDPQSYGLGVKEIWEIPAQNHESGFILHSIGWPMDIKTYGGGWMYHYGSNLVSIGYVTGLDYANPTLSPFEEMQRWKTHPAIKKYLAGGRRISYGARALVEGGIQSLPRLAVAGALLVGDTAGFLNVPKIKGNHTAMKSGMLAAEAVVEHFKTDATGDTPCTIYTEKIRESWLWRELYAVRNIRPGFHFGLIVGLINAAWETVTRGLSPWTLRQHNDYAQTKPIADVTPIAYPKPDNVISFDRLSSVHLSNTNHDHNQAGHLVLRRPGDAIAKNFKIFQSPETKYCPAGVYEIVTDADGPHLQINAQNCVHCKTCDIKDPGQNIDWTVPEGGGGPRYVGM